MKLNPKTLSAAAQSFGVELASLHPLGGMDGVACEYQHAGAAYVLKIIAAEPENANQIHQITEKFEFINYLAKNGVRVARPVFSPQNNWIETIETEEGRFLVTAATKAAGHHFRLNLPAEARPEIFRAWGQVTGQMHALAKSYPTWQTTSEDGSPASAIHDWKGEHDFFSGWCQFDDVRQKWHQVGEEMETLPRTRAGFGLIHNDLHPWNFLVHQGEVTVIDFDVCCYHWFLKDLAIAMFFANWHGKPGQGQSKDDYLTHFFHNFMEGYATKNTLEAAWFKHLPLFLKHHQILLFTVFTDEWKPYNKWEASVLKKWKRQILNDIPVIKLEF